VGRSKITLEDFMKLRSVRIAAFAAVVVFAGAIAAQADDPTPVASPVDRFSNFKGHLKASATKVSSTEGGAAAVAVGQSVAAPAATSVTDKAVTVKAATKTKAATVKTKAKAKATTTQTKAKTVVTNTAAKTETGRTVAKAGASMLNINTAPLDKLEALPGVSDKTAQNIISGRPYTTTHDLVTKKVVSSSAYSKISGLISVK
jgi:competence protein ComEA